MIGNLSNLWLHHRDARSTSTPAFFATLRKCSSRVLIKNTSSEITRVNYLLMATEMRWSESLRHWRPQRSELRFLIYVLFTSSRKLNTFSLAQRKQLKLTSPHKKKLNESTNLFKFKSTPVKSGLSSPVFLNRLIIKMTGVLISFLNNIPLECWPSSSKCKKTKGFNENLHTWSCLLWIWRWLVPV